uniref:Uncharacterized protein n=1 Tax=Chromera velia CCMP2878 TaxID=1169474 RepID=A0A0G4I6Y2_9ALVE|eukprot:Cvel_11538.t1-p1 / transcript=Cvel_11538.t1 / gene=Cvel_11538 / organism=Chromera_velia_CCMP2878 / gene_product=hypothetical protein / transcript_product=hypothetical protein / location=Cvel_scaffold728:46148-49005(+) / protein_length=140 / sequence_SO=supercontig / SO=protein_coding / is_pseudo=false
MRQRKSSYMKTADEVSDAVDLERGVNVVDAPAVPEAETLGSPSPVKGEQQTTPQTEEATHASPAKTEAVVRRKTNIDRLSDMWGLYVVLTCCFFPGLFCLGVYRLRKDNQKAKKVGKYAMITLFVCLVAFSLALAFRPGA